MTYILSADYYADRHYESIGHARRIAWTPRGDVIWSCECGAKSRTLHSERGAKAAHARHVAERASHRQGAQDA